MPDRDKQQSINKKRLALVIFIALLIPIIPFIIIGELPGELWLQATSENALLFAITGGSLMAADVLLPIPSSILGTLIGAKLGFVSGFITILAGLTIGNIIGYSLGRFFYKNQSSQVPEAPTLITVFFSRPVPVLAEATAIVSGAVKIPFLDYFFVTLFGNCMYAFFLATNGLLVADKTDYIYGIIFALGLPTVAWLCWKIYPSIKNRFLD